ncbi:nitroreductase family deazaflavin-dependent oxidoreductase [Promicromonospora sp. NPDC050880]|uniref:nitroreductase family deazaflavin-dependent oxidoreductase n=1 Tax=Promicromonospora sp. NPDC050880 TaxID=3364406 RepID=UPI00379BBCDC
MWGWILGVLGGLVVLALAWALVIVLSMRYKNPRGLALVRRFNRRFTNRGAMRDAGEPGSGSSVIRHVGRRSGKPYATPIGVYPMGEGFLVFLPYGLGADWVRNIRAAGTAELVTDGHAHRVTPRLVEPAEALPYLSAGQRRVVRLFRVRDFLALDPAPVRSDGGR